MTLVDDRPAAPAPVNRPPLRDRGAAAPWRLAARMARRETRRRPGRTVLAALLIAVPVFAMTVGSVTVRTEARSSIWKAQFERRYPGADVAVDPQFMFGDGAATDVAVPPAGTRTIDYLWTHTDLTPAAAGARAVWAVWSDMPLDDPMVDGAVELLEGHAAGVGELVLHPDVADALDVGVGDTVELARPSGTWTVAGIGRERDDFWTQIVIAPGFDRARVAEDLRSMVTLHDLPDGATPDEVVAFGHSVGGITAYEQPFPTDTPTSTLAWGWVGGVLALVAVGIIVAAAFATSARRQLVAVGQLASNGATPSMIRRTLVLQGTWTAAAGAVVGIVTALVAVPLGRGVVEGFFLRRALGGWVVSPGDLVAIALTALAAGTVAAAVPARSLSRVPVMSALAGRRPLGQPPRWLVHTGVALTLGGLGLLAVAGVAVRNSSDGQSTDLFALVIILATVAVVFGMVCATPLVVERAGSLAGHLSLSPRLALRGMARSRTRSAAVVAAVAVAVGGSVAVAMVADDAVLQTYDDGEFAPDDALVLVRYDSYGDADPSALVDPGAPTDAELDGRQQQAIESAFAGATIEPLLVAAFDPPPFRSDQPTEYWVDGNGPLVATPALLDVMGFDAAARRQLADEGSVMGAYSAMAAEDGSPAPMTVNYPLDGEIAQLVPTYTEHPPEFEYGRGNLVVTREYAEGMGFTIVQRGLIVRAGTALTDDQRDVISATFQSETTPDVFIEPGDPPAVESAQRYSGWDTMYDVPPSAVDLRALWIARAVIVGIAVLVSGLVVAIGLSLAAAEGRDERDTLTIVGATPATMRRQAATRAAVLALTGIALGIPTGFLPTMVLWRATDGTDWPAFPLVVVAILVAAVPLVVAGATWLSTAVAQRLRPTTISHRD